ncbi:hypothetical protein [Spirosoma pomorum]
MRTRFFTHLVVVVSLLSCVSCKKDSDVDPREQYYGTYKVTSTTTSYELDSATPNKGTSSPEADVLIVGKGESEGELLFALSTKRLKATMSDKGFSFPSQTQFSEFLGTTVSVDIDGEGSLTNNAIDFTVNTNTTYKGSRYRDVTVFKGSKL